MPTHGSDGYPTHWLYKKYVYLPGFFPSLPNPSKVEFETGGQLMRRQAKEVHQYHLLIHQSFFDLRFASMKQPFLMVKSATLSKSMRGSGTIASIRSMFSPVITGDCDNLFNLNGSK